MIKAVIFDYGGVVKTAQPLSKIVIGMLNIPGDEMKRTKGRWFPVIVQAEKGLISDEQMYRELFKILDKPVLDNPVELAKEWYKKTFTFVSETLNLIKELESREIKTAVLSNIFKFEGDVIRENKGYDEFDPVILSCEVGMRKPEPEIYVFAVKKMGLRPDECIFVDDKEENLLPAKELGLKIVLFKDPKQAVQDVLNIIENGGA